MGTVGSVANVNAYDTIYRAVTGRGNGSSSSNPNGPTEWTLEEDLVQRSQVNNLQSPEQVEW